jgi:hypothetical protein
MTKTATINRRRKSSAPVFGELNFPRTPIFRRRSLIINDEEAKSICEKIQNPKQKANFTPIKKIKKTLSKVLRIPRKCSKSLFFNDSPKDATIPQNESILFWEEEYEE